MRFHCGFSFSWRTIKKFLFPFLLGILAFFGLSLINDETALGFIKVNALENYDTTTNFYYFDDISRFNDVYIDNSNHTFSDFFNYLYELPNINKTYFISFVYNVNNKITTLRITASSTTTIPFSVYNYSTTLDFRILNSTLYNYNFSLNTLPTDIFTETTFLNAITCLTTETCSSYGNYSNGTIGNLLEVASNDNNTTAYNSSNIIYYCNGDLIFSNDWSTTGSNVFYKTLYVNDEVVLLGNSFPTFYDYINRSSNNEPSGNTNHSLFFNYIYWFDDNTTTDGILSNIYIILFLYCIGMLTLKFINIIRNTRWK